MAERANRSDGDSSDTESAAVMQVDTPATAASSAKAGPGKAPAKAKQARLRALNGSLKVMPPPVVLQVEEESGDTEEEGEKEEKDDEGDGAPEAKRRKRVPGKVKTESKKNGADYLHKARTSEWSKGFRAAMLEYCKAEGQDVICKCNSVRIIKKSTAFKEHFKPGGKQEENLQREARQAGILEANVAYMAHLQAQLAQQVEQARADGKEAVLAFPQGLSALSPTVLGHRLKMVKFIATSRSAMSIIRQLNEFFGPAIPEAHVDPRAFSDLIPVALKQHKNDISKVIEGKMISVAFDGTTATAETLAVVFRYVSDDLQPVTLCVRLMLLKKALRGDEIAFSLMQVLTEYRVAHELVLAWAHDRASSNGLAMERMRPFTPGAFDMPCLAHFFDNLGDSLKQELADKFVRKLTSLFSRSPKARVLAARAPYSLTKVRAINDTRWYVRFERNG